MVGLVRHLDALIQCSKTANFQQSKKHSKLKEYSVFINAINLLDDSIKCNYCFQALFYIVCLNYESFKIPNKIEYQLCQQDYQNQYSDYKI